MAVDDVGRAYLVDAVRPLHPEEQTVVEMLQGWRNQQLSRNLQFETIDARIKQVQRFIEHSNEFPWTWTVAMVDEFFGDLRSIHKLAQSSIRSYQVCLQRYRQARPLPSPLPRYRPNQRRHARYPWTEGSCR